MVWEMLVASPVTAFVMRAPTAMASATKTPTITIFSATSPRSGSRRDSATRAVIAVTRYVISWTSSIRTASLLWFVRIGRPRREQAAAHLGRRRDRASEHVSEALCSGIHEEDHEREHEHDRRQEEALG